MTYYSTRKSILNGEPQQATNKYGTRRYMERQYHLFCANACDGEANPYDVEHIGAWRDREEVLREGNARARTHART